MIVISPKKVLFILMDVLSYFMKNAIGLGAIEKNFENLLPFSKLKSLLELVKSHPFGFAWTQALLLQLTAMFVAATYFRPTS